ncbi:MAG: YebC/PmpR family DNA-binding transcriptional regulator, partial [Clostridia bacterium]|nr:YebC/PmpR family DNA-binding transcriptional regulator [Clostridia bacterium]
FSKLGKEITIVVKAKGGNPDNNPTLRTLIAKAKAGEGGPLAVDEVTPPPSLRENFQRSEKHISFTISQPKLCILH